MLRGVLTALLLASPAWADDLEPFDADGDGDIDDDDRALLDHAEQVEIVDMFVVFDNYGKTRIYELSEAGVATAKFDVAGDVFKWERLR